MVVYVMSPVMSKRNKTRLQYGRTGGRYMTVKMAHDMQQCRPYSGTLVDHIPCSEWARVDLTRSMSM